MTVNVLLYQVLLVITTLETELQLSAISIYSDCKSFQLPSVQTLKNSPLISAAKDIDSLMTAAGCWLLTDKSETGDVGGISNSS